MAEVFLVEKGSNVERVTKLYALKRILPQFADDRMRVNAFVNEMALAASIDHQNVIHLHDWGQDEETGLLFLVMDFVRGMDLRALSAKLVAQAKTCGVSYPGQERGVLPMEVVAWAGMGALQGLDYLHHQKRSEGDDGGMIHRDVSPDNIMMDIRGHVRVTDLGVS